MNGIEMGHLGRGKLMGIEIRGEMDGAKGGAYIGSKTAGGSITIPSNGRAPTLQDKGQAVYRSQGSSLKSFQDQKT